MADNELFRQVVKAMALGDGDRAQVLNREISPDDRESFHTYVTAMFAGAAAHRFEHDQSREAIDQFVNEMRHDYRKADPAFKPLVMEGLLRALFGEEHLIDEISPEDQLRTQFLAIRKIVDQSDHMRERLDDYLTDAQALAEHWSNED